MSREMRTYRDLGETDRSDLGGQVRRQLERVASRLASVRHVVAVTSGKGGVGKSLTAASLAVAAAARGRAVGLLDADLDGPTAARFLGVAPGCVALEGDAVVPPSGAAGVRLMSMGLLIRDGDPLRWREPESESFVWRGAQARGAVREFLSDVRWGELDLLLVDLPPGYQRLAELRELVPGLAGAVAVAIPSEAAGASVERSLTLCRQRGIPIMGIVENMAGYRCPGCGGTGTLFPGAAGRRLSEAFGVPVLARVPFDPGAAGRADRGDALGLLADTAAGAAFAAAAERVLAALDGDAVPVGAAADAAADAVRVPGEGASP